MERRYCKFGNTIRFVLFLRGYFNTSYLGYEAAEGIDWVWEHRLEDLATLDLEKNDSGEEVYGFGQSKNPPAPPTSVVEETQFAWSTKEQERLVLQQNLDSRKTQKNRNVLGQFATPPLLAKEITKLARLALNRDKSVDFLEPAFGTGSFYSALLQVLDEDLIGRCWGYEIDPYYAEPAQTLWKDTRLNLQIDDFATLKPPEHESLRFDLVLTNPPYVRHHHLDPEYKKQLQHITEKRRGFRPSGLSGWNNLFANPSVIEIRDNMVRLGDLFHIKRGIATGANKFFILTESDIARKKLPSIFFKPILPSPRYLNANEIKGDSNGIPSIENRLFLLSCELPESVIKSKYPTLWNYLQEGIKLGIKDRYLCSKRTPWYSQETRQPSPILCTYMGRSQKEDNTPFRFILNDSSAVAPNVYLNLYPKHNLQQMLSHKPQLIRSIWKALGALTKDNLLSNGRTYGGGLHKIEPKELANVKLRIDQLPPINHNVTCQGELFTKG